MNARYERATIIQQYTRDTFPTKHYLQVKKEDYRPMDPMQFTTFNFDHGAHDHATGIMHRYIAQKATFRRMPVTFSPCSSPRQDLDGKPRNSLGANGSPTTWHTSYITIKTRKSYLSTLLPSSDFSIQIQGGWSTATFSTARLGNLAWLGGRGYSHFGLYIHDVSYIGPFSGGLATRNEIEDKKRRFPPRSL